MAWRRGVTGPSGVAPTIEAPGVDQTALCRHCCTLIRYWPDEFVWRHVVVDLSTDHPPEPMPESEARLMDGNR